MDGYVAKPVRQAHAVRSDRHGTGDQSVTPVVPEPTPQVEKQIPVIDVDALADLESLEEQGDFSVSELIEPSPTRRSATEGTAAAQLSSVAPSSSSKAPQRSIVAP